MWTRRIMVGCGVVFLVTLMLVCTFSLGFYLGERGTRAGKAPSPPPAGPPPNAGQLPIPPGGPPNVIGTLQRYGDNTLTLASPQGPRTIALTPQTAVRRDTETALVSDLRPGMALAVWGDPGGGGRALMARVIVILVPEKK